MQVIRNFIHILGITPGDKLPEEKGGRSYQHSEVITMHIPEDKPPVKTIYEIMLQPVVKSAREIITPAGTTLALDGVREIKMIYTEDSSFERANFIELKIPFNFFISLDNKIENLEDAKVYIIDAYFDLLDNRNIYSCILFYIHIKSKEGLLAASSDRKRQFVKKHKIKPYHILKKASWENMNEMSLSKQDSFDMNSVSKVEKKDINCEITDIDSEYL